MDISARFQSTLLRSGIDFLSQESLHCGADWGKEEKKAYAERGRVLYDINAAKIRVELLWLPPVVQEIFDRFSACDRLRASFRPILSGVSRSRGRYGDQQIGSKS